MREKIEKYIRDWESNCYFNGLPDEAPKEIDHLVPSYRKICIAILKNDITLKTLGFSSPPCQAYNDLKRLEISQRPNHKPIQLRLF